MNASETLLRPLRLLLAVWLVGTLLLGLLAAGLWAAATFPILLKGFDLPPDAPQRIEAAFPLAAYSAGVVFVYGGIALPLFYWLRRRAMLREGEKVNKAITESPTYFIMPSIETEIPLKDVSLWTRAATLLPSGEHLSFELSGGRDGIAYSSRAIGETCQTMITQYVTEFRDARARPVREGEGERDPIRLEEGESAWQIELRPSSAEGAITPVLADPMTAILSELARLPAGIRAGVQVLIRSDAYTRGKLAARAAQLTSTPSQPSKTGTVKSKEQRRGESDLDRRAQMTFLETRLIVWAVAPDEGEAQKFAGSLARTLASGLGQSNPLTAVKGWAGLPEARRFDLFSGRAWGDAELALVAHVIGGKTALDLAPQLKIAPARPLVPLPPARLPVGAYSIFDILGEGALSAPPPEEDEIVVAIAAPAPKRGWLGGRRSAGLLPAPKDKMPKAMLLEE